MSRSHASWVESANNPACDFPIENLPYGVFDHEGSARVGVAIGDFILDLHKAAAAGLLAELPPAISAACMATSLNALMVLGAEAWSALRNRITILLAQPASPQRANTESCLVPMAGAKMHLPAEIGDFTDFYASLHHAMRVGRLFRPDQPLLPNYRHLPIGYNGRASSIIVSGEPIVRPCGQIKSASGAPVFSATRSLDFELEVGAFVGAGNRRGEPIPIAEAEQHIFGLCLVNDWSARDMQAWEYQPLGPFLAKSFATSISPWVVPLAALAPYRSPVNRRGDADPPLLPYLTSETADRDAIDLHLEVWLQSQRMRTLGMEFVRMSRSNLRDLYWSLAQLVTHHASNGCNLRTGDLIATGTISGPEEGSEGCLLEMQHRSEPSVLPTGERRLYLEDGDCVQLRAYAQREGGPRIGFGTCSGTVAAAVRPDA